MTVNDSNGPVYGLRQSTACLTQGDSGGSPGSNCSFATPRSDYQRVNLLLSACGLSLVLN